MAALGGEARKMKIYGVVGWKNSGKTTLMERLVAEIVGRGVTVSTVKHAHHAFDIDHPGKDSYRHRQAGAREVLVCSGRRWALMHELDSPEDEPPLETLLGKLTDVELVLIEGYKRDRHPKVEAHRSVEGNPLIAVDDPTIRAIAAEGGLAEGAPEGLARFDLDDVQAVADFILAETGLGPQPAVRGASV